VKDARKAKNWQKAKAEIDGKLSRATENKQKQDGAKAKAQAVADNATAKASNRTADLTRLEKKLAKISSQMHKAPNMSIGLSRLETKIANISGQRKIIGKLRNTTDKLKARLALLEASRPQVCQDDVGKFDCEGGPRASCPKSAQESTALCKGPSAKCFQQHCKKACGICNNFEEAVKSVVNATKQEDKAKDKDK